MTPQMKQFITVAALKIFEREIDNGILKWKTYH